MTANANANANADEKRYSLMELAAKLDGVISLGRGDPDLDTPRHIIERACEHMASPPADADDPRGLSELRTAVARCYRGDKDLELDPDAEILVTNGAQEALFLSVMALLDPGDEILVPDPRYGSYDQAVATAGGVRVDLPTGEGNDFSLSPGAVERAVHDGRGKVLLLVNPSNPTGALTPHDSVTAIAALARDAGLFVISDEVYEKLAFGSGEVTSVATCPGMRERTVTLSSVSKSYAMTGFRVGFLLGPSPFIRAARRLKSAVSGPTPLFSQLAALAAVDGPQDVVVAFRKTFEERLGVVAPALDRLGVPYGKPGGGFFLWADVSQFAENAETFCRKLLLDERVLIFPGTAFGEKWKAHVRISLLQPVPRLEEAVARLTRFVDEAAGAS